MWNPNIKVINITKLVEMIVNAWFGYFEYVGCLLHSILLTDLKQCIDLIAVNFNWSTPPCSIIQWEISSTKFIKPLLTHSISHSTFLYCTNFFLFGVSFVIFTFLEIIKLNMLKCYFFPAPFNIKMAIQKFINFDKFLKNACWHDSYHNTI